MPTINQLVRKSRKSKTTKSNSPALGKTYNSFKKSQTILYNAFDIVSERTGKEPMEVFEQALKNIMPVLEVRARRVGGANYQVPVEVRPERRTTLGLRWLVNYARLRGEKTMEERLANEILEKEILDSANNTGASVKKLEDTHKMAYANRSFAHYRW